jgi:hypothetical protein
MQIETALVMIKLKIVFFGHVSAAYDLAETKTKTFNYISTQEKGGNTQNVHSNILYPLSKKR